MAVERYVPLRHGWGGNIARRNRVLKDRREEDIERELFPEKFQPTEASLDIALLEEMQKPRHG